MEIAILLVGSGPRSVVESSEVLEGASGKWLLRSAATGREALDLIGREPVAAVVADLRLPDQKGTELLDAVMRVYPGVHRLLLADLGDASCVGVAHQFLAAPLDAKSLLAALGRSLQIERYFPDALVRRLCNCLPKPPSLPYSYLQLVRELERRGCSMESVSQIISQDEAVTTMFLRMVNSVAMGLQRPVSSVAEAMLFLGLETAKSVVVLAHVFSSVDAGPGGAVEELWPHALAVGRLARGIARAEKASMELREECNAAGLLHDFAKFLLAAHRPVDYGKVIACQKERHLTSTEAEMEVFGVTHAELGGWIGALWGLPVPLVEAITRHHAPAKMQSSGLSPLTAVHAANVLVHEQEAGGGPGKVRRFDQDYLVSIGLANRVGLWRQLCRAFPQRAAA